VVLDDGMERGGRRAARPMCPWNVRFAAVAAERDYAARDAWDAYPRFPSLPAADLISIM